MQGCIKRIGLALLFLSAGVASAAEILERPVLTIKTVPAQPKVGERVSVFAQVETDFFEKDLILEGLLGSAPANFKKTAPSLWVANFQAFSEVKSHDLLIHLYLRDSKEGARIEQALRELKKEIRDLEAAIAAEADLAKKALLEEARDQKVSYSTELETALDNLKVFFSTENFSFSVNPDPANSQFPSIASVSPNAIPLDKRVRLLITGTNFPSTPHVKIAGTNASILSASATSIEVLSPRIFEEGPKTIEITFPALGDEPKKNAFLTNALFVTAQTILTNLRPVAVVKGYQKVDWPVTTSTLLDASQSYDENGNQFSYEWNIKAIAAGSALVPGTSLANSPTPAVLLDKKGIYRFELRLRETDSEELKTSFLNTVTVEVK